MKLLLDTHALLWFALGDTKLSSTARREIESPQNSMWVSPASYWEIALKVSLGKYALPVPFEEFVQKAIPDNGFTILPIEPKHAAGLISLPFHHRDPFDRMMIAQALAESCAVVSGDQQFDAYSVQRIW